MLMCIEKGIQRIAVTVVRVDAFPVLCYDSNNYCKRDDGESTQHQHSTENIPEDGGGTSRAHLRRLRGMEQELWNMAPEQRTE